MNAELKKDQTVEGQSRYENIESLLNRIKEFSENEKKKNANEPDLLITINEYLDNVALITDADNEKEEDRNKVSLMTAHQAKGLEYDYVYIAGMEENLFPGSMSSMSIADTEEERRLFYVALTRAKVKASVSFAVSRYRWGKLESNNVSRFVREIDDDLLETSLAQTSFANKDIDNDFGDDFEKIIARPSATVTKFIKRPSAATLHTASENFVASDYKDIRIGMRIEHERFGFGKVVDIDKNEPDGRMVVMFDDGNKKTLIFKYAKVRIC
jgi:DNA helicase-2/ATP-dependent DNA helicase PcrA